MSEALTIKHTFFSRSKGRGYTEDSSSHSFHMLRDENSLIANAPPPRLVAPTFQAVPMLHAQLRRSSKGKHSVRVRLTNEDAIHASFCVYRDDSTSAGQFTMIERKGDSGYVLSSRSGRGSETRLKGARSWRPATNATRDDKLKNNQWVCDVPLRDLAGYVIVRFSLLQMPFLKEDFEDERVLGSQQLIDATKSFRDPLTSQKLALAFPVRVEASLPPDHPFVEFETTLKNLRSTFGNGVGHGTITRAWAMHLQYNPATPTL